MLVTTPSKNSETRAESCVRSEDNRTGRGREGGDPPLGGRPAPFRDPGAGRVSGRGPGLGTCVPGSPRPRSAAIKGKSAVARLGSPGSAPPLALPLGPLDPLGPRLLGLRRRWRLRRQRTRRAQKLIWRPPWPTCPSWPDSWRSTRT